MDAEQERVRQEHIREDARDAIAEERREREWGWEEKERADYKRRLM